MIIAYVKDLLCYLYRYRKAIILYFISVLYFCNVVGKLYVDDENGLLYRVVSVNPGLDFKEPASKKVGASDIRADDSGARICMMQYVGGTLRGLDKRLATLSLSPWLSSRSSHPCSIRDHQWV